MAAPTFGRRLAAALLLICLLPGLGRAAERILSFDSRVVVEPDGRLRVTETIRVRSEGREIRRGIYRDFPTDYRGRAGERVRVGFTLLSAERDGRPEPWHSEMVANGLRVYLGDKDVVIPDGEHVYRLAYETTRQLGFFSDYDELYWNVTGNGWIFPIDRVRAVVALPPGARVPLQSAAYTGPAGSTGRAAKIEPLGGGEVAFTATQTLAPHEGLTVAVAWPKGLVAEPSREEELGRLLSDNAGTMLAGAGLVLLLGWYLYAWFTAGRDPEAGPVVPLFSPPEGLSPAACRYLSRLGFDHKALAAAPDRTCGQGLPEHQGERRRLCRRVHRQGGGPGTRHRRGQAPGCAVLRGQELEFRPAAAIAGSRARKTPCARLWSEISRQKPSSPTGTCSCPAWS